MFRLGTALYLAPYGLRWLAERMIRIRPQALRSVVVSAMVRVSERIHEEYVVGP